MNPLKLGAWTSVSFLKLFGHNYSKVKPFVVVVVVLNEV